MSFFDWFFNSKPSPVIDSIHVASTNQAVIAPEYIKCWAGCVIQSQWQTQAAVAAQTMLANKSRYQTIELTTGVPWFLIAAIHYREASFDFTTYLGNGDPLDKVTVDVPSGRGPFETWELGAIDALNYDSLSGIKTWDIPAIFWHAEEFNGFGYRTRHYNDTVPPGASPYIYSGSNYYSSGLYVEDGVFHQDKIDDQCGIMILLKQLEIMKQISL